MKTAKDKWPELHNLALKIANDACKQINQNAPSIETNGMPYKQQCTLEMLISILEQRV